MKYQDPKKVDSPRQHWKLFDVIYDGGEGEDSLAVGEWTQDGESRRVLASRWNGHSESKGNPQSRGLPTWYVLPDWMNQHILEAPDYDPTKLAIAKALLGIS